MEHRVSPEDDGGAIDRCLRRLLPGKSWNDVRRLVRTGKVSVDGRTVHDPAERVRAGALLELRMSAPRPTTFAGLDPRALVYVDTHLVVVEKPAGVSTVPFDDRELGTLDELVRRALSRRGSSEPPLGVVHRLDKDTSGLLVFARTLAAKRGLKQMFRFHAVLRRYDAIVHGTISDRTLRSRLVKDRGDGYRGSTDNPKLGREAVTHVRLMERLPGASLVECRLETGRTHQIRIHLAEAGHPLLGERVYAKGFRGALLPAPRLMLHARALGFDHPVTGKALQFEQALPTDMGAVLRALRA